MTDEMLEVSFSLNGQPVTVETAPKRSVLKVLREEFGQWSLKPGCSPQGICGCCVALINGKPRLTCTLPAKSIAGKEIVTLEGIGEEARQQLATGFVASGAVQCGYCTPGIVTQAHNLLEKNDNPTRDEITRALQMHICRCTGWNSIVEGIERAAALKRGEEMAPVFEPTPSATACTKAVPRHDGYDLALGRRPFIDDMLSPEMLHAAVVWTPFPRCIIDKIDLSDALEMPGVQGAVLAADVPGERKVGLIFRDWPILVAEGEETRCVADILAVIAAETADQARAAVEAVKVEATELTPVTDCREALNDPTNVLAVSQVKRGDVSTALENAACVVSDTFETQVIDQAFLEPEAALAIPLADGAVHIYSCGQGVFDDRRQLCDVLDLPLEKVLVELMPTGGGFGAKEDLNIQPHAALLALKLGRPVRLCFTMEESTRYHPKRHPLFMDYTVGTDKEGKLLAVRARLIGDTGGYASVGDKVLERAAGHACGPYTLDNVDVEARTIYTNNPVNGAMRGFGVNQVAFAMEQCLDRIADKLGIDRLEIRYRNALREGDRWATGQIMNAGVGIVPTLDAIKPHYEAAKSAGKHVGVACGIKNVGMGNGLEEVGRCVLEIRGEDDVICYTGFTDMGQGHDTIMAQFAAETSGLPTEAFTVICSTAEAVETGMTTASRATYLGGLAALAAGEKLAEALDTVDGDLGKLVGHTFFGDWHAPITHKPEDESDAPLTHYAFGFATQLAIVGSEGTLEELVAAHDVGRAINPPQCRGQIEGGVHMGIGYALTEELVVTDGVPDDRFRNLGIIKAHKCPKITAILVEHPDPDGPLGAKGIGEIGLVPTAPAIAAALHSFDGEWRTRLPMKDTLAAKACGVPKRKPKPAPRN